MRGYTQLTRDERYQIYALRKAGHSQKEIAEVLRRNPSTISRELGRNKGLKGYRPEQAHRLAQNRKKERDRTRIPESTWARVEQLLREDWSPEQISGWLGIRNRCLREQHQIGSPGADDPGAVPGLDRGVAGPVAGGQYPNWKG